MLAELCKVLHIDLFLSFYSKLSTKKRELAEGLTAAAEARKSESVYGLQTDTQR